MKKVLQVFIFMVIFALTLYVFAGCRNNSDEGNNNATPTPTVTQGGTPDTTTPDETPNPADLLNRDIRVICWWQYLPNTDDPQPDPATSTNYQNDRLWRDNQMRIEEQFGVTFSNIVIPRSDLSEAVITSVLAGDPIADLTMFGDEHMLGVITGNIIMSADMYASPQSDLFNANRVVRPIAIFQDKIWSFGRNELETQGHALVVNMDILNAIGGQNPVELWERGEWTWDALRELMELAMISTVGGETVFGIGGPVDYIFHTLIASNDGIMVDPDTWTYAFDHPNTMAALQFGYDIFSQRMWHYDPGAEPMGNWWSDFIRFMEGRTLFFFASTWAFESDRPHFEYTPLPFPIGPNGSRHIQLVGFPQGMTITAGVQNPSDVYMLYEELLQWAGDRMYLWEEGAFEYARNSWLTEDDVQRMLHHIGDHANKRFDVGMAIPDFPWIVNTWAGRFFHGEMGVATAVESDRGWYQSLIDDFLAGIE